MAAIVTFKGHDYKSHFLILTDLHTLYTEKETDSPSWWLHYKREIMFLFYWSYFIFWFFAVFILQLVKYQRCKMTTGFMNTVFDQSEFYCVLWGLGLRFLSILSGDKHWLTTWPHTRTEINLDLKYEIYWQIDKYKCEYMATKSKNNFAWLV